MITYTHPVADNLPMQIWLLGDGQKTQVLVLQVGENWFANGGELPRPSARVTIGTWKFNITLIINEAVIVVIGVWFSIIITVSHYDTAMSP